MRRVYLTTAVTCLLVVLVCALVYTFTQKGEKREHVTVGFIYEDDESMPYTRNFALSAEYLQEEYPGSVQVITRSNVPPTDAEEPIRELIRRGCDIIFTSSNSDEFVQLASEFPDVQFCQVSYLDEPVKDAPENYHTFKGEIYQGRYVSGVAAGMKLREMIDRKQIKPEEALVGFVGAFPSAAIISGYTAFLLGVRSVAPEAVMKVKYTNVWGNFTEEKECTRELIDSGCVIISHHTDTNAPAIACEEESLEHTVYLAGYNQGMLDVAPSTALVSTRINWVPYVTGAVEAVLADKKIEKYVKGHAHGNDMSAGFERNWVQMLDLNTHVAADGTAEAMNEAIEGFKKGTLQVFKGDYTGISFENESDTFDLREGFAENKDSSSPSFKYVLEDCITVLE